MKYAAGLIFTLLLLTPHAQADTLKIHAQAIKTDSATARGIAPLEVRAAFELNSNHKDFGGISGMRFGANNRIYMISDAGQFISADIGLDKNGVFQNIENAFISPLPDPEGKPLPSKRLADSEALSWAGDKSDMLVSFEFRHRVWRYQLIDGQLINPVALNIAPHLAQLPSNGGIEAIVQLSDDSLLLFSEEAGNAEFRQAWRLEKGQMRPFTYKYPAPYVPTDAVNLNDEWVLILNRHFTPLSGVSAILTGIKAEDTVLGRSVESHRLAKLAPPFPVDNFEALDVIEKEEGWDIFILSDDNFNPVQKTLLLQLFLPRSALPQ